MEETNSNTGAIQRTGIEGQPAVETDAESMIGSPLPVEWIVGGVILLILLVIAKKSWMA